MIDIILRSGRERSALRRHPWILSGSVARTAGRAEPGDWARVIASDGRTLGYGHYSPVSQIRVRMLAFSEEAPGDELIDTRIRAALRRRTEDPLLADTNAQRLVNAEGDDLPGLVVDRFAGVVVVKLTAVGMFTRRARIARILEEETRLSSGMVRADESAAKREGFAPQDAALWGPPPPHRLWIEEAGGRRFAVDVAHGQKTGFYLDQRDGRDLAEAVARGRTVLDLYAHTGGFAVAAARGGAVSATLVESSKEALDLARVNFDANSTECSATFVQADVHRFLREDRHQYDLIIVDPPPLAKTKKDVDRAARAYKDALLHAFLRASAEALVFVYSCSHHVGPDLFRKIVFGASLDAKRTFQVLRVLGAPPDHPVSIDHPEGEYLTGLLLRASS